MKMPARLRAGVVIGLMRAAVPCPAQTVYTPSTFITLAGGFSTPSGVAVDHAGNIYAADWRNHAFLKGAAGEWTTLAGLVDGPGSDDGTGSAARFNGASGVAVDKAGNVYVADD